MNFTDKVNVKVYKNFKLKQYNNVKLESATRINEQYVRYVFEEEIKKGETLGEVYLAGFILLGDFPETFIIDEPLDGKWESGSGFEIIKDDKVVYSSLANDLKEHINRAEKFDEIYDLIIYYENYVEMLKDRRLYPSKANDGFYQLSVKPKPNANLHKIPLPEKKDDQEAWSELAKIFSGNPTGIEVLKNGKIIYSNMSNQAKKLKKVIKSPSIDKYVSKGDTFKKMHDVYLRTNKGRYVKVNLEDLKVIHKEVSE